MIRGTIAAFVSFLFPGLGHMIINFQVFKGFLIMVTYMLLIGFLLSNPIGWIALVIFVPVFHIFAAISAFKG